MQEIKERSKKKKELNMARMKHWNRKLKKKEEKQK